MRREDPEGVFFVLSGDEINRGAPPSAGRSIYYISSCGALFVCVCVLCFRCVLSEESVGGRALRARARLRATHGERL